MPKTDGLQKDVVAPEAQESADGEEWLELSQLTRSAGDAGWKHTRRGQVYLPRLQSTRKEAEAIVAVTPAGQSFEALDFKANRSTATSGDVANYRIVHFATHALSNIKHPELSGLVLSLVDERGRPQSGFLGLEDIYNLNLPAELVVLSACETALGKGIEGEGMVGLTRGFLYAGASRVMASLGKDRRPGHRRTDAVLLPRHVRTGHAAGGGAAGGATQNAQRSALALALLLGRLPDPGRVEVGRSKEFLHPQRKIANRPRVGIRRR